MNEKRTEDTHTDINVRIAKLEDSHNFVKKIHDEWPILEARVSNLEKDKSTIEDIKKKQNEIQINQIEQKADIRAIKEKMTGFINKHKEDAPKAIKAMKRMIATQITVGLAIVGFVIGVITWQTKRIIELQDCNIKILQQTISDKNNEKKD